jgi:hypothetical protein
MILRFLYGLLLIHLAYVLAFIAIGFIFWALWFHFEYVLITAMVASRR